MTHRSNHRTAAARKLMAYISVLLLVVVVGPRLTTAGPADPQVTVPDPEPGSFFTVFDYTHDGRVVAFDGFTVYVRSLEVHTFQQAHATGDGHGIAARKKSIPTKTKRANGTRRAPAAPEPADGHLSRGSAKRPMRSKDERADENLLLFER
jgi:hypothetical protein